jgi:hypothetical protein
MRDLSAVGAALNLGPLAPVLLGAVGAVPVSSHHIFKIVGHAWCRAYGAQVILGIDPQPFRAGLKFSGRPSGPSFD